MNRIPPLLTHHARLAKRRWARSSDMTLIELMVATAISLVVGLCVAAILAEGVWVFRSSETEMWAREKGSRNIRKIYADAAKASSITIYPNYSSLTATPGAYGSCVVLALPDTGTSVAYYIAGTSATAATGSIYYDANIALSAPSPNTDTLMQQNVSDLEFRQNPNGSMRIAFAAGFVGYPRHVFGSKETDLVRYSMSVTPRN